MDESATPSDSHPGDWGGPYIPVACLCEQVLIDQDGLVSPVRILDRIEVPAPVGAEQRPVFVLLWGIIVVRAAGELDEIAVHVVGRAPSGRVFLDATISATLGGPLHAANMRVQLPLDVTEEGLCRYDFDCADRFMNSFSVLVAHGGAQVARDELPLDGDYA